MSVFLEPAEQDRLVKKYLPLARNIARQVAKGLPIEMEDAIQAGHLGLVEAVARFDVGKHDPTIADLETNLKSFAYLRIRGAVIDEARRMTFVRRRGLEKGMRVFMTSIDELVEQDDGGTAPGIQVAELLDDPDLVIDFKRALEVLTPRERKVVMGLAVGARGKELAAEFDITESRVSQIAAEARHKLEMEMVA